MSDLNFTERELVALGAALGSNWTIIERDF